MKIYFVAGTYFLVLVCFGKIRAQSISETRVFQPAEMQQDFTYLRKALENTHPGLYMHQSRELMQHKMDSLYNSLDKPTPFFDFYKIIAYLIAEVKCEHTYCNPYSDDYGKRAREWKVLPLQLFFANKKAYVAVNLTADTTIHAGDEVLSINTYPLDSIQKEIYKYIPADGNMESGKESTISSMTFNISYYLFIERPAVFNIEFKNQAGQTFARHFTTALTIRENNKLALANPANKEVLAFAKRQEIKRKQTLRLELVKEQNTAIITIKDFGGNRKKVFSEFDNFFNTLKKENIGNLIIDLSYNGGGDEEYACELLSYLIQSPTRFIESEYLINDEDVYLKISNLPKDILQNKNAFIDTVKDGKIYAKALTKYSLELKTFAPKSNGFKGRVFFYVNGGTSSAASTCAANAQSHKLATIVGNETAGCFAGGGTTNGLDLVLPNSKITAHTSIVYCKFATSGKDKDRGVLPDYYFTPGLIEFIKNSNGWREFIYALIRSKR